MEPGVSTAQHTPGPRKTYASGYLNNSTGKWNATAWSAVPVDGIFTDHRTEAHVKGFESRADAERAAIAKATGSAV
jgi:hypothetical protein